jgi:hypothetical protein
MDIFGLSGTGRICWSTKAVRRNGRWTARLGRLFVALPCLIMCDMRGRVGVEREVAWLLYVGGEWQQDELSSGRRVHKRRSVIKSAEIQCCDWSKLCIVTCVGAASSSRLQRAETRD